MNLFKHISQSESTRHIHGLHPYKGKFIPQLVDYFLDEHTDDFKKELYFKEGDWILDPFCGSGTTLVCAAEHNINAIGTDVSEFSVVLSNTKLNPFGNKEKVDEVLNEATELLANLDYMGHYKEYLKELEKLLGDFNREHFSNKNHKYLKEEIEVLVDIFTKKFEELANIKYMIFYDTYIPNSAATKWLNKECFVQLEKLRDGVLKIAEKEDCTDIYMVLYSKLARALRATTHSDLTTFKKAQTTPYYCTKHKKICVPTIDVYSHWKKIVKDFKRMRDEFERIITGNDSFQIALHKDSKTYNFGSKKFDGVITSPPYIGTINYQEQQELIYELWELKTSSKNEIGKLDDGVSKSAQNNYINDMVLVFKNVRKALKPDANMFVIVNDKFGLYDTITKQSGFKIVGRKERVVSRRSDKSKGTYSESILHLKLA